MRLAPIFPRSFLPQYAVRLSRITSAQSVTVTSPLQPTRLPLQGLLRFCSGRRVACESYPVVRHDESALFGFFWRLLFRNRGLSRRGTLGGLLWRGRFFAGLGYFRGRVLFSRLF